MAVARLMLDNFDHVKAYWIMLGLGTAQNPRWLTAADDLDGNRAARADLSTDAGARKTPEALNGGSNSPPDRKKAGRETGRNATRF